MSYYLMDLSPVSLNTGPDNYVILAKATFQNEEYLSRYLSDEELYRAKRYKRRNDYVLSICAHALKRIIIGQFLNKAPNLLNFKKNRFGKPFCSDPGAPFFSLSHSGEWVAIGVSSSGNIGIDIEFPSAFSFSAVAYEVLSEHIARQLEQSGSWQDFLLYWTQKEAVVKACGLGLSIDPRLVEADGGTGNQTIDFKGSFYQLLSCPWKNGALSIAVESQCPISAKNMSEGTFVVILPDSNEPYSSTMVFEARDAATIRLYNTMVREKETFVPKVSGNVSITG